MDGAFKRHVERQPVIDLARGVGARLLFLETTCEPAEQRRRLERRQEHDTRSDGRVEIMEQQKEEFEGPNPDCPELFDTVSSDGPKPDTRRRVLEILEARDMLAADELAAMTS